MTAGGGIKLLATFFSVLQAIFKRSFFLVSLTVCFCLPLPNFCCHFAGLSTRRHLFVVDIFCVWAEIPRRLFVSLFCINIR